jgi:acetyl-CoA carboxylase biotin carboxyl carrier protein
MDFNQIQELIRMMSKYKLSEFILKDGEFKLEIRNNTASAETAAVAPVVMPVAPPQVLAVAPPAAAPVAAAPAPAAPAPAAAPAAAAANDDNNPRYKQIKSPMVGTFYRSSGPDKPPFIKVGDSIEVGNKVCIIEAMKLFNEIESEIKGKVVKVLVEDASPVEYDQPLFLIDPA